MKEAEIQLQNALLTTFLANLAFLSEYDNQLYHRVDELSRMIENGTYKEKYALEFIIENGDFDIYDLINDKYLYDKRPKEINDKLVRKVELDEKNSIYFVENYFAIDRKLDVDKKNRFSDDGTNYLALTQNDMFEYSNFLNDFLRKKKKKLKKIEKFVFLGTLLGRHIPRIAEKIDAESYLVLERNLEIFRLSLFTVDYTILGNKGVVFSIMDNPLEEEKRIQKFMKSSLLKNYMLKFSSSEVNIDKYIDTLNTTLHLVNNSSQYTYTRYLYSLGNRVTQILDMDYKILLMNQIKEKLNFFDNIPVLYIAAGPSLDESMEWIKENQNKFFIVTIGAAYKKLLNNNIKIDMITTLDESAILNDIQFDDNSVSKINQNTIILASVKTNISLLSKLKQKTLFLYEVSIPFHKNNITFEGYSIGEITLDILLKMNAKEIYLIGLDLALDQETGESHSKNSSSSTRKYDLNKNQKKEDFSIRGLVKVKGNMREEVSTIGLFYNSIKALEEIVSKEINCNIYNLSFNGAYFENVKPLDKNNIKIEKFKNLNYQNIVLINLLNQYSLNHLNKESKKDLKEDIKEIENIINIALLELLNCELKTYEEFYEKVTDLYFSINVNNKLIIGILKKYLMMLIPYLSYHFNDIKIKNEPKKVNKIKEIYINQLKIIFEDYIFCLKRLL
ncbi:6-hydroxymethylpterin diphosphokinase MptE-like protein [Arcobacter cloacae]|uniref:Uncharacterized protein n=1 Tax=Arcobacter cloacae TaxID=1054034 RepID=A0A6M8NK69_9BACT|nr:6-hydroxymethylpterin diphosphokinase MptE-like protein [Arcobacter cloacae]QKF90939.1 motility accessory factor [Arcobacter cloacae]RXI43062.1 hypothetical protein CP963_00380 [Arcobacter cloacae]